MENLQRAAEWLERLGFVVKFGQYVNRSDGYLAGTDQQRLDDLHAMFADPAIKAIVCSRGGYGCARFADRIDFDLIRKNPKIFWGYSDITYLLNAFWKKTGLVTFHGPMPSSDLGRPDVPLMSRQLFSQLFQPTTLRYDEHISPLHVIHGGSAEGRLIGGNLSLLVSTLGTPFELDTRGCILLIEDVGEQPYRVDGMLNQLRLAGKLERAAGFVIGDFRPEDDSEVDEIHKVIVHYIRPFKKPAVSGFLIGHCQPHFSVPLGTDALLDADRKQLWVQPGVK